MSFIPQDVKDNISSINLTLLPAVDDMIVCTCDMSGDYSARSGYNQLLDRAKEGDLMTWNWVWRSTILETINFFLWQLGREALPTRTFLV